MPTVSGETLPRRGETWWVLLDQRRPAVVVQSDTLDAGLRLVLDL